MSTKQWKAAISVLTVLSFLLLSSATVQAQKLGDTVKDDNLGVSLRVPKDWVSIPVEPTEKIIFIKYQADRAERHRKFRYDVTPGLDVLFFPHVDGNESDPLSGIKTEPGSEQDKAKKAYALITGSMKSYDGYVERYFGGFEKSKPQKKKIKKIPVTFLDMVGSKVEANGEPIPLHVSSAVFKVEEGTFVMQFICLEQNYKKRHKSNFAASFRSFKRIEKGAGSDEEALALLSDNERYIQEQIQKLPKDWNHFWSKKKNYMIFSNADKVFTKEIEKNLEGIHDCYVKMFPGKPKIGWKPIVRVCKTKNEYHGYGGPQGSAGYWSDGTKEFVFYNDVGGGAKNTMIVLKHEAFHHFMHFYLGTRLSTWYDEGHADYFSGGVFAGKRIKIKPSQWRRGTIQSAIVNGSYVPLKEFVNMSKAEYYAKANLCYAQGWSLIYFFREGKRQGARMKKEWQTIPDRYLEHLIKAFADLEKERPNDVTDENTVNYKLAEDAVKHAMEQTFGGWTDKDWKELEEAWADFIG